MDKSSEHIKPHGQPASTVTKNDRHEKFLECYLKYGNQRQCALKAGFPPSSAATQGKRILQTALRRKEKSILESNAEPLDKRRMLEKLGLTSKQVLSEYVSVVKQNRDLGEKLKALKPLLSLEGLELEPKNEDMTAPQLNLTIVENTSSEPKEKKIQSAELPHIDQ